MASNRRLAVAQLGSLALLGCQSPPMKVNVAGPPGTADLSWSLQDIRRANVSSTELAHSVARNDADAVAAINSSSISIGSAMGALTGTVGHSRSAAIGAAAGSVYPAVAAVQDPPPDPSWLIATHPTLQLEAAQRAPMERIAGCMCRSLLASGYPEPRFFRYRDGFAAMTIAERFDRDGNSWPGRGRFVDNPNDIPWWSLREVARRLILPAESHWRVFAFTVHSATAPGPVVITRREAPTTREDMTSTYNRGAPLPPSLPAARKALLRKAMWIYEFEGRQGDTAQLMRPGILPAEQHLARTGIFERLSREFTQLG